MSATAAAPTEHEAPARVQATGRSPGRVVTAASLIVCVLIAALLLYALWAFWPTKTGTAQPGSKSVHFLGLRRTISTEILFFVIVAVAGAIGGLIHATRSFAWHVAHRDLKWRWLPFYSAMPVIGASCATIFYVVIRGGFFAGPATTKDVNPYGFAAVGALVGLFTEQALEMLRRVADQIFAQAPQAQDDAGSTAGEAPTAAAPVAVTGAAVDVGPATATLQGTLNPNGQPTTFYFEYGPATDYGQRTDDQTADGDSETGVSAAIAELAPASEYHFRLVAQSRAGTTAGDDAAFTTTAAA